VPTIGPAPDPPGVSSAPPGRSCKLAAVRIGRSTSLFAALFVTLVSALLAAPLALADNGTGLAGPTTDKTVTFFCFGVIAFFAITVIVLSLIQERLERRKEQRHYDLQR